MKLKTVHVTNLRSVLDSGPVEIGATTCLVGKNEAGKTAFLKALEGPNQVDASHRYDRTRDYPRRHLASYDRHNDGQEAKVISTVWILSDAELEMLTDEFGPDAFDGQEITVERRFASGTTWTVPLDHAKILDKLSARFGLKPADRKPINERLPVPWTPC